MANWNIKHKVVLITGATGGLGRVLSDALVKKGCKLALVDLDQAALDEMVAKYGQQTAGGWVADVRSMDQLYSATKAAAEKFGRIDIVIAGAGIELFYPTLETSVEGFERIIDINLNGVFRTFKAAYPWVKQSKGYLLTVSSMAAFVHVPYGSGYVASKAGNFAFTNALRSELEPFGIAVGSVHPTWFDTPMVQGVKKRPAWKHLMNNDKSILGATAPIETVRDRIIAAIEGRRATTVVPWYFTPPSYLSNILRPVFEWLGPNLQSRKLAYTEFMKEETKL